MCIVYSPKEGPNCGGLSWIMIVIFCYCHAHTSRNMIPPELREFLRRHTQVSRGRGRLPSCCHPNWIRLQCCNAKCRIQQQTAGWHGKWMSLPANGWQKTYQCKTLEKTIQLLTNFISTVTVLVQLIYKWPTRQMLKGYIRVVRQRLTLAHLQVTTSRLMFPQRHLYCLYIKCR